MKRVSKILVVILMLAPILTQAQTSAGKCWEIDYNTWNINQPQLHILCGNDSILNLGEEMTMEVWIRPYNFAENRKLMGKTEQIGGVFDNGYVLGFQNMNIYTELWNPNHQEIPYTTAGPLPVDSAFVHIASTYSVNTAKLSDYVNGNLVGEVDVFPASPISPNQMEFVIGAAPWGPSSFQFYGVIDEVRIWNTARTEAELEEFMYKQLRGDEAGLVAYYNFNNASDTIIPDESTYNNTGALQNSDDPCWSWADSYIPVGDEDMYDLLDPVASWNGKLDGLHTYATTDQGLSVITSIVADDFTKYLLFARTDFTGTATDFAPAGAPADFERAMREWYVNTGGYFTSKMYFELNQAAGGGAQLPTGQADSLYSLLYRADETSPFIAVAHPDEIIGAVLVFNDIYLVDGYYTVSYGSDPIPLIPLGIEENRLANISIGPNPAKDQVYIHNALNTHVVLYNLHGMLISSCDIKETLYSIDTRNLNKGIYFLVFEAGGQRVSKKIIIQ